MNKNLPKSKYDEHGRPIKKGVFKIPDIDEIEGRNSDVLDDENKFLKENSEVDNSFRDDKNDNFDQEHLRKSAKATVPGLNVLIAGLVSFFVPFAGFFVAIGGIILAFRTKEKSTLKTIGLILCIFSLVSSFVSVLGIALLFN